MQKRTNVKRAEKLNTIWLAFQIESETKFLTGVLVAKNYNLKKASEYLGIQRSHLYNLMKKYGITRPVLPGQKMVKG